MIEENKKTKKRDDPYVRVISDKEMETLDHFSNMLTRTSLMKRTEAVNTGETIRLVRAAMGDRSIRKFAEELSVSPSSISRILNGSIIEIRNFLLVSIAYNADPGSDVTLDNLLKAQGFTVPEERRPVGKRDEWESKWPISNELLLRGYSVRYVEEVNDWSVLNDIPTYIIRTDAYPGEDGKWYFYDKLCKRIKKVSIAMMQSWIDGIMAAYYRGLKAKRVSIVIDSYDMFIGMKKLLERYRIRNEISIILVSLETGKIYDEYIVPLEDGTIPVSVLHDETEE